MAWSAASVLRGAPISILMTSARNVAAPTQGKLITTNKVGVM
jgi:hypothetical protein